MSERNQGLEDIGFKLIEALTEALGETRANEVAALLYDLAKEARAQAVTYVREIEIHDALIPIKEALAEHRHLSTGEASIALKEALDQWIK